MRPERPMMSTLRARASSRIFCGGTIRALADAGHREAGAITFVVAASGIAVACARDGGRPGALPAQALDHARRTRSIMLQNVGVSLALIAVLIPLALFGILGLAAVVLVHEVAEILIIGNGVRAGRLSRRTQLPTTQPAPALEPAA